MNHPYPDRHHPAPCGDTIHSDYTGTYDDQHHPAVFVHARWVSHAREAFHSVRTLHRCNPEDLVPRCNECRKVWPCPTIEAVGEG